MVAGLAILEMYVLVAVLRLRGKGQVACNFEQALEEYMLLNQMQRHPDAHPRPLALQAFERLLAHGLLTPADASARSGFPTIDVAAVVAAQQVVFLGLLPARGMYAHLSLYSSKLEGHPNAHPRLAAPPSLSRLPPSSGRPYPC